MAYVKKYTNIRMGASVGAAVVGPQTFPSNTGWVSVPVPCRGAKAVVFTYRATDANTPASTGIQVANDPLGSLAFNAAGASYNVRGGGVVRMNAPGGLTNIISHVDPNAVFFHGFAQAIITSNAGAAHTAFEVDVEVHYAGDADVTRHDVGQFSTNPV